MYFLYRIIFNIVLILSPLIFLVRLLKKKETLTSYKQKICLFSKRRQKGKLIWFHGASVGEVKSVIPMIEKLELNSEFKQILITSNTISSSEIINNLKLKKTVHQFFPIDANLLSNKFINFWKPSKVIFIDSEIWPNTLQNLNRRKIPVILLNARITKKTFKRWMLFKMFAKKIFSYFSVCYPANQETKNYLKNFNVKKIKFIGNIKYAQSKKEIELTNKDSKKKTKQNRNIWCAASTHYNEEVICGRSHIKLKNKTRNLLTIIIPRHIERSDQIKDDLEKLGLKVIIAKDFKNPSLDTDIMIVKAYGKTKIFFENSPIVFLGGSLINHGGQNPLEATRSGCNIIHGPNIHNFKEIYNFLNKLKISHKVTNEKNLTLKLVDLFNKKNRSNNNYLKLKSIGSQILKSYYNDIILKR